MTRVVDEITCLEDRLEELKDLAKKTAVELSIYKSMNQKKNERMNYQQEHMEKLDVLSEVNSDLSYTADKRTTLERFEQVRANITNDQEKISFLQKELTNYAKEIFTINKVIKECYQ